MTPDGGFLIADSGNSRIRLVTDLQVGRVGQTGGLADRCRQGNRTGASGKTGATGKTGAAGKVEIVTCTATTKKVRGRSRKATSCKTQLKSGIVKFSAAQTRFLGRSRPDPAVD